MLGLGGRNHGESMCGHRRSGAQQVEVTAIGESAAAFMRENEVAVGWGVKLLV